jgi:hypothetical protein
MTDTRQTTAPAASAPTVAPAAQVTDAGTLRLGGMSPLFPAGAVADAGKLRLGGMSPLFGRS